MPAQRPRRNATPFRTGGEQHRPTATCRFGGQPRARVHGPWPTNRPHRRDVFVAIGVEVAVEQVQVALSDESPHGLGLADTPDDRFDYPARELPFAVDLEVIA